MSRRGGCYVCGAEATTREHVPPRCFFPKAAGNQQLLTVPSCPKHNTAKSNDDQYVLAQICINAAMGDNLAKQVFQRSVAPQFTRSPAFAAALRAGSKALASGGRAYLVDVARVDRFFDHLVHALFFARYGTRLDPKTHAVNHVYLSLSSDDPHENSRKDFIVRALGHLAGGFPEFVHRYEAATLVEPVYEYRLFESAGASASITIRHYFYGVFEVVSLLSRRPADT